MHALVTLSLYSYRLVPNRKGQPLLVEWQVACRVGKAGAFTLEPFATFAQRAGLQAGGLIEDLLVEALKKEATFIPENFGLNQEYVCDLAAGCFHQNTFSFRRRIKYWP